MVAARIITNHPEAATQWPSLLGVLDGAAAAGSDWLYFDDYADPINALPTHDT